MKPAYIGRYEIHALLGQGGMGTVYRARDPMMDRWVAIKTLTVQDSHQQARFQQEVRAAGSLNHPHITTTYDVGAEGDLAYIVMELVEGSTLASRLSTPAPWPEALELLLPVCQALAYAHQRGVIHRDVKPANILISNEGGIVKLADFGLARLEAALRRITESGSTVGTPLYTAPEQIRDETVDGRADLFSLGIVLFELISGQHPFTSSTMAQAVYRITQPEPADLTPLQASIPPAVLALIEQALQKEPLHRFAGAAEMASAMHACLAEIGAAPEAQPALRPDSAGPHPDRPASPPPPSRQILTYVASDLHLDPEEEQLLQTAFSRHDTVYLEREFRSGYSGARVLLATPVRSGRRLAQLVLKIDARPAIEHEWRAYREFVSETLPPVTARILEAPQISSDGRLALLQYSFAGGLGNVPPESLRSYYARHSGEEVATLLEKNVFQAFGDKWWLQRHTHDLILRREYDRLLPVHLLLEHRDFMEATATPHNLVAGQVTALTCRRLERGQMVQVQGFRVEEARIEQSELTLQAVSSTGGRSDPIRIRLTGVPIDPTTHQAGQVAPPLTGLVTATRQEQLRQWAEAAFPDQDFSQKQVTIGGQSYLNPLYDTESLLDQRISSMRSIIHGDLNLENILVTPSSGLAWLIDFATTRQGHNLFDFMRLETQIITKLLPQTGASPEAVAQLMVALHQPNAAPHHAPPALRKPFTVLLAVRRMVRKCLYSRDSWDEYYLGLIVTLLGSLKFREMGADERRPALAAAAALRSLVTNPSLQLTPSETSAAAAFTPTPPSGSDRSKLPLLALAGVVALLLVGLGLFATGVFDDGDQPASTTTNVVAALTPPATGTPPPTFTRAPSHTATLPARGEGLVLESLNIHGGPGLDYPPLGTVPLGNMVQITGRSADGHWWQIAYPDGPGGYGWLLAEFVRPEEPIAPPIITPLPPPSPTPTLSAAAAECLPRTFYRSLANANPELGCPTEVWLSDFTFQEFEQGLMLWRKSPTPAHIYSLYENNSWRSLPDPQGPPRPACDAARQNGDLGPIYSFGLIWCTAEMDRLGQPLTQEQAARQVVVERFEDGLVFELNQTQYLLFDDRDWESIPVEVPATREPVAAAADMVENFEQMSSAAVQEIYDTNDAWQANALALDIVTLPEADGQALKLDYTIQAGPPDNYAGIERNLPAAANWSAAQALQFWVKNDDVRKELTFQWGESPATGGEIWKHSLVLEPNETRQIVIPLTGNSFQWADWSPAGNGQMDLSQVKYYGFFLQTARPNEGTLHLDSIALVEDGTTAAPPVAPPTPACKLSPAPDFQPLWAAQPDALGCPVASARTINFLVEQTFQGGRLFWREDTDEVYLTYDRARDGSELLAGDWQAPPWKWDGQAGCNLFEPPPAGLQAPERGFGWLWCTHLGGPTGSLGWALDKEESFDNEGRVQRFEHGLAFKGSRPKTYGLLDSGRFVAYDPAQANSSRPAGATPAEQPASSSLFVDTGYRPAKVLEPAWRALGAGSSPVGYPSGPPISDRDYAQQYFERGFMFWWDSPQPPQPIWVIFMSGPGANEGDAWQRFDNRWYGGQPEYPSACPEARPPLGPKSGFGVTWCTEPGIKAQVGQPVEGEFGSGGVHPPATVQFFQGGLMFHNPADQRVWVLVDGNGWVRY